MSAGDGFTPLERRIDAAAHRLLARAPRSRAWSAFVEFLVFGAKQAWACIFGAALLVVILAARLWYPDDAWLARNDALTLAAVAIQVVMVATKLETLRELRVIILFHIVGTVMELFKTDVGSWAYDPGGVLRLFSVPLFTGFMYGAIGSYMVRVYRLFDLRFTRYPRRWITAILAAAIYANFFTHHYVVDLRWVLLIAVLVIFGPCTMHFRVFRKTLRMPLVAAFALVAFFIWLAENLGTWGHAWTYPDQVGGWELVPVTKLVAWFLLMIISVVLVAWLYPPRSPDSPVKRSLTTLAGMADSSFDVVSKVDKMEADNAVNQAHKEIEQRYDFKNIGASVEWSGDKILMKANSEERVKAILDVLQSKFVKRGISLKSLDHGEPFPSGKEFRIEATLKEGIEQDQAKKIGKLIRDEAPKSVKSQIQGDELRVSSKSRDDLQATIALLKGSTFDVDLQFVNFR
jgi:uncharacterized membrane protein YoaT (DUF817 family)/uncharacterized protein YajQ (UPF0234 family)